jgi:hypothetical protein
MQRISRTQQGYGLLSRLHCELLLSRPMGLSVARLCDALIVYTCC